MEKIISNFEFYIASRYFKGRENIVFLKIINYISIIGVAIGVATLIVVMGVMNGFDDYLQTKIVGITSHITVSNYSNKYFSAKNIILDKIKKIKGVAAAGPVFTDNVILKTDYGTFAVLIKGVDAESDKKITNIYDSIIDGKENYTNESEGILIGNYLSKRLGVKKGDMLTAIPAQVTYSAFGIVPGVKSLKILGIFKTGMFEYDNSCAYCSLKTVQSLFKKPNLVTGIEIKLNDLNKAGIISNEINETFNYEYYASSWSSQNSNLFAALKLEKSVMFIILTLIIGVAALNIGGSIIVLIVEKTKEIGILRAMGASRKNIAKIFLLKGFIIGIIGSLAGLGIGLGLSLIISKYKITIPGDVYYIEKLPIKTDISDLIIIMITAVIICLGASIIPALRASKLEPVEAMRNE